MPSQRRLRLVVVAAITSIVILLFYSSHGRDTPGSDGTIDEFYSRTVHALDERAALHFHSTGSDRDGDGDGDVDEDDARLARDMAERLRAAEQQAKDLANQKAPLRPDNPDDVIGVGSSADGQGKKRLSGKSNTADLTESERERVLAQEVESEETEEEHAAEVELNAILKKAPIIIFSKTYCSHSKRAKRLLLEQYKIEPEPYVVELDDHKLGRPIQDLLAKMTGRNTVPNILVNSVSIGGADDITEMDSVGTLKEKLEYLGNNKVTATRTSGGSNNL